MFQSAESRYNQWVREHYRFLLRSAWALTGSRAVAEDVVQDCFTSAWKYRSQLRRHELARAWLFRIMRRSALRHIAPHTVPLDDDEAGHDPAAPDAHLDDRLDVVRALACIAPIHREVLVLYYFDDMATADMAEALKIAPGTVLSRLARARIALKASMAAGASGHYPRPTDCTQSPRLEESDPQAASLGYKQDRCRRCEEVSRARGDAALRQLSAVSGQSHRRLGRLPAVRRQAGRHERVVQCLGQEGRLKAMQPSPRAPAIRGP